jgi:hypothetical protein
MEKVTTRVIATLSVFLIFLAVILTGWQGTIKINSFAGGVTLDSRSPVAINQVHDLNN